MRVEWPFKFSTYFGNFKKLEVNYSFFLYWENSNLIIDLVQLHFCWYLHHRFGSLRWTEATVSTPAFPLFILVFISRLKLPICSHMLFTFPAAPLVTFVMVISYLAQSCSFHSSRLWIWFYWKLPPAGSRVLDSFLVSTNTLNSILCNTDIRSCIESALLRWEWELNQIAPRLARLWLHCIFYQTQFTTVQDGDSSSEQGLNLSTVEILGLSMLRKTTATEAAGLVWSCSPTDSCI